MAKVTRIKSTAGTYAPQTKEDCARDIKQIGDLTRQVARIEADMNDQIAKLTEAVQQSVAPLKERLETMQKGVQTWCEANRDSLTDGGKVKSANLITGIIQWRQRPPSCTVRGADTVIETLKRLGLGRFVRTKEEVNKEAILNETDAARGVAGITINSGIEDFVIEPFEQNLGDAA